MAEATQFAELGYKWTDDERSGRWLLDGAFERGPALPGTLSCIKLSRDAHTGKLAGIADTSDDLLVAGVRKSSRFLVSTSAGEFEAIVGKDPKAPKLVTVTSPPKPIPGVIEFRVLGHAEGSVQTGTVALMVCVIPPAERWDK